MSLKTPFEEDPRIKAARRTLALTWAFFSLFLAVAMAVAASFGNDPPLFGLPRWVALACIVVPAAFVAVLIPIVEKLIPEVSLSDEDEGAS